MEVRYCVEHGIPHSEFLEWDPSDRSKVIAHLLDESQKCSMCGSSEWEWKEDRYAYEAAAHTCRGCQILDFAKEGEESGPGVRMILITREKAEALMERSLG